LYALEQLTTPVFSLKSTLQMVAADSSEMTAHVYKTTRHPATTLRNLGYLYRM